MNKQIHAELEKIEAQGLKNVKLLALVSGTSYEVLFYADVDGKMCQSNDLAESGIISISFVEDLYETVANVVREDKKFDAAKMNIIKASDEKVTVEYDEKKCKIYSIKKKWKEEIGI